MKRLGGRDFKKVTVSDVPRFSKSTVLVTGGHGFLGRALRSQLASQGFDKVLAPSSVEVDLLDRQAIRAWLGQHRPELVFHLAARVGGIGANEARPADLFHDNLIMGVQLLDECHRAGVSKVVAVATVCADPSVTSVPFSEDDLWLGYPEPTNAPYGIAKKMLLVQSQAYRAQHGFNSVVLFPANLYGPGDNFDLDTSHVIPAIIRKIDGAMQTGADEVHLWGDGTPTREFFYVDDCARALLAAAERHDDSAPINIGTGDEISIRECAEVIGRLLGWSGRIVWQPARPNGQLRRRLNVSRARERLGFVAEVRLEEGLKRTVDWWQRHRRGGTP